MVGVGKGAENGILIKSGEALETAHKLQAVVFDKTGTLTKGEPEVTDIIATNVLSEEQLLQYAAVAEKNSEHPLGEAIVKQATARNSKLKTQKISTLFQDMASKSNTMAQRCCWVTANSWKQTT